jgi:hypothetical protein
MAGLAAGALVLGAVTYTTSNLDGDSGDGTAGRDSSGAIVTAGGMLLEDLRPGDCFNDPTSVDMILAVEAVPCSAPHDNEVFSIFEFPADRRAPYPGEEQTLIDASGRCLDNMEAYVGAPFKESGLDIFTLFPVESAWAVGDRRVVCSAYDLGFERLLTSVRSTGGVIPDGFATVWSLAPGECFEESYGDLVPVVPCSGPHFGMLFESFELDTPVLSPTIDTDVDGFCMDRAKTAFTALELAGLDVFALRWPGPATWTGGDREVACVALDITAAS